MHLTNRELWALAHGLLIGGPFLLAFTGALVSLNGLRSEYLTSEGFRDRVVQLRIGSGVMAVMSWAIVLTGTWVLLRVAVTTGALIALGLLGTFPPFFNAVGG
jgi:hypothetical protein